MKGAHRPGIGFFLLMLILPLSLVAQQEITGNWLMFFGTNRLSDKLSIHTEAQYRSHSVLPLHIEQLLLRAGLNYHFSDQAFVTAGYAYIESHEYESEQTHPESVEHRIWQQFILNNNLSIVKFEHRYRVEQRWVNSDYRNRFRYRLMLFVPLNKPEIEKGAIFIGLYDEIFLNTKEVFFDRNRLYGALGYQFHKIAGIQVGLMHQQQNNFGKWYFQCALVSNPDFRNTKN